MKMKKSLLLIPALFTVVVLLTGFGGGSGSKSPSGAPAGYTGSPFDNKDCTSCHSGSPTNATGIMSSNVPASGYVQGTNYTITVTLTGSGNKGFEVSPQSLTGTLLGTITPGAGNKVTGTKYITHNAVVSTSPAVWNFTWTAPATSTGPVTFYGAFVIGYGTTKLSSMVVNPASTPALTATASATPASIVQGGSSQLNVTATGGTGTYTYAWTSVPAGFTSTLKNPVVTPSVTTQYNVTVTSGTQSALSSATVTVIPTLTAVASANPMSIVAGGSSQLNVTVTGGTGSYTYAWTSVPAGFTSTLKNPVVTPSATTQYNVTVTSGTQTALSSATVTVIPALTATASANPASIVAGGSSQLNVVAAGGTGTFTYAWTSVPAGFTSNIQNPVVSPTVATQYNVVVTSGAQNANSNVTVSVTAGLTATASANPATIVQGGTSQLNVVAYGGSGSYSYSWSSVPAGFNSSLQNPVVSPSTTTQYNVVVTSGSQSANSSATVTVIPSLTATASATPASIVQGGSSQLNVTAAGGTGTYTYAWTSVPAGFTSSLKNPVVTPSATTQYNVVVSSGSQTANSSATVTVIPALTASASANPATIAPGGSSQLNVVAAGGTGTFTYAWTSVPAGFTSNLQNPVVSATFTTQYNVVVTSGTQSANSNTAVTVTAGLAVNATATPATIIAGASSQLNASASGGAGSYAYSWTSVPAGFNSSLQNPVVSPSAATQYNVVVSSGSQTANSSATVTVIPVLTASASANPATIAPGGSSQLNVVAAGGTGTFTYAWTSVPAGFTSSLQNPVVSPSATIQYNVVVSSGAQNANSSVAVTVTAGLAVNATATPATIIAGASSQLNAAATGGAGSYAYSWTSVPAGFTSNLQNPVVSPSATTVYSVQVTSGSATANASATVTVVPVLSANASAEPASIVQGASSQLDVTASGGTGSYTYAWTSAPAGFMSTLKNPVVSPIVSTTYNVQVTSGAQSVSSSASVTVIPALTVSATATPASILPGGSSQLNAAAAGGNGSYSYSWTSNPAGFTSNLQNPVVSPAVNTTYTVEVTSGIQTANASTSVSIGVALVATASANPASIIQGTSSQLSVVASGGNGSYTCAWTSVPAGFTSSLANPVVSPNVTTTYTVHVTSGSTAVNANATVTVIPLLGVTVTANPSTITTGGSSQLNAAATGGTGTYAYSWTSNPAGFSSNLPNPVVSPTATTTYTVQVVSGTQTKKGSVNVNVSSGQALYVKARARPSHIERGERSHLYATPIGGNGSYTYSWTSVPSGFHSTQQNPYVRPRRTTKYYVRVTSGNLTATASTKVYVEHDDDDGDHTPETTTESNVLAINPENEAGPPEIKLSPAGVDETVANNYKIVVSPNPCQGLFRIKVEGGTEGDATVSIMDFLGKSAFNEKMTISELQSRHFDMSRFPKGVYLVIIRTDNVIHTSKLVVQ
jgi:hypothetical protein